jgi:hypothetical protein
MPEPREGVLYPLMVIAAISVILFSLFGIAAMLGYLPPAQSPGATKSALQVVPTDSSASGVDPQSGAVAVHANPPSSARSGPPEQFPAQSPSAAPAKADSRAVE